ncbi:adenylate/guanylate cyclase domain-containing protein, partial [Jannaschia aquimarina]
MTKPKATIRLSTLLPLVLAALIVGGATPTILVGYAVSSSVTEKLVLQRAETVMDGLEAEVQRLLDPVEAKMDQAQRLVAEGMVDPTDEAMLRTFVHGLLAGTPQVFGIGWIRLDGSMLRWERDSLLEIEEPLDNLPFTPQAVADARAGRVSVWAPPFYSFALGDVILNHRAAMLRDGTLLGLFGVGVTGAGISRYAEDVSARYGVTAFVMAGRDRLVAYPGRVALERADESTALPLVSDSTDPVVAAIWDARLPQDDVPEGLAAAGGHLSEVAGDVHVYFTRRMPGYGPAPLTLVVAVPAADTAYARNSPAIAASIGLLLTSLAAVGAWVLGRHLARRVGRLDDVLGSLAALDFEGARQPDMERSRLSEWRSIGQRAAGTAATLEKLATYVPRVLTRRLLDLPERAAAPEERDVTVMFLDLEGFTRFAGGRPAAEVAHHLSGLFEAAGPLIEAEGGVIDKYTGDGLMAFWGAPEAQPDHAERALRAARRLAERLPGVLGDGPRARIGLHSGPALVGDIGFAGRVDYTLTGETVNVAQRVEAALRGVAPEARAVIGASAATLSRAGGS